MKRYLLCKKCGIHRFYVHNKDGEKIYFHVDFEKNPFPTDISNADLKDLEFEEIYCCGCSWSGSMHQLVKYV